MKQKVAATLFLALFAVAAIGLAWATEPSTTTAASTTAASATSDHLAAMKAEFSKCFVCKNMVANMDELGPVMQGEVVKMNNGMALVHSVSDPTKVELFHASCQAMGKAGEACMTMTDEQAKTELCTFCQGIRSVMKSGASMSKGMTANGDLMVITSSDPATLEKIAVLEAQCAEMMSAAH